MCSAAGAQRTTAVESDHLPVISGASAMQGKTVDLATRNFLQGSQQQGCPYEAVLWTTAGIQSLEQVLVEDFGLGSELAGWQLTAALAVSDDGRTIVGFGTNPLGFREGWIATIPEPGTGLLLACGLVGLGVRRRLH